MASGNASLMLINCLSMGVSWSLNSLNPSIDMKGGATLARETSGYR